MPLPSPLSVVLLLGAARADDAFCADLRRVVGEAGSGFASLRGDPVAGSSPPQWEPRLTVSGAARCAVEQPDAGNRFTCAWVTAPGDDWSEAYGTLRRELSACMPTSWTLQEPGGGDLVRRFVASEKADGSGVRVELTLRADRLADGGHVLRVAVWGPGWTSAQDPPAEPVAPEPGPRVPRPPIAAPKPPDHVVSLMGGAWVPGWLAPQFVGEPVARAAGWTVDLGGMDTEEHVAMQLRYGRDSWDLAPDALPVAVTRNRVELSIGLHVGPAGDRKVLPGFELLGGLGGAWGWQTSPTGSEQRMSGFGVTYQAALPVVLHFGGEYGLGLRPAIRRSPFGNGDGDHRGGNRYDYGFMTAWEVDLGVYLATR